MSTTAVRIAAICRTMLFAMGLLALLPAVVVGQSSIQFEDVTKEVGLAEHVADWELGHGGAWGDVTGNDRPDLYIGAFADRDVFGEPDAPMPNMLLLNEADGFELAPDEGVRLEGERARTSMALLVDLTDNGKLDLLAGTHSGPPSRLFENRWPEPFRDVTPDDGGWPRDIAMRNAVPLDLDRDGLLDLILIDGGYGGPDRPLVALRNKGDFQFENVTAEYGLAGGDSRGLGTAIGDVNNDGRLDVFIAHSNRLFISRDDGRYREYRPGFFSQRPIKGDNWPCGAVFADLTGNGLLDLVYTVHGTPAQIYIYVNRGLTSSGLPRFQDVTRQAGLDLDFRGVPVKGAHLALVDLDHDGRRDILLSMVRRHEQGQLKPVVLRNAGVERGIPRFDAPPIDDSIVGYYATAPVTDYDRDGRIDMFMATWSKRLGSHLFRNVTETGNYLMVSVEPRAEGLNSMGIGATVRVYEAGRVGDADHLLGRADITLGNGYSSGDEAFVHFGLADTERCDVEVTWQGHAAQLNDVEVNQHLVVPVGGQQ